MEFLVPLAIAGVVASLVVQDARALRNEEIEAYGSSTVSPGLWGVGVFLMAIIFLPAYVWVRVNSNKQIALIRQARQQDCPVSTSEQSTSPVASPAATAKVTALDQITQAYDLLSRGAITEQEYEAIKTEVLR